jgi:hypothetical protein
MDDFIVSCILLLLGFYFGYGGKLWLFRGDLFFAKNNIYVGVLLILGKICVIVMWMRIWFFVGMGMSGF